MTKKQLMECIRTYIFSIQEKSATELIEREFGQYFIYYLEGLDFWPNDMENYLPGLVHNAIVLLEESIDNVTNYFRISFEKIIGDSWPEITNISNNKNSSIIRAAIIKLFTESLELAQKNKYCLLSKEYSLRSYFDAKYNTVKMHFNIFLQKVYQQGLFKIIKNSGCAKMKGYFGRIAMSSYLEYSEVLLVFENTKSQNYIKFISKKIESLGLYFEIDSYTSDIRESLDILDEVISLWPQKSNQQMDVFQGSYNFSF